MENEPPMDHERAHHDESGNTSPDNYTVFSRGLVRSDSQETLVSTYTAVGSSPSINYPGPPMNSPDTQSLASDISSVRLDVADQKLTQVPGGATPPGSDADPDEGKAHSLRAHLVAPVRKDMPLLNQLFKQPPNVKKRLKVTRRRVVADAGKTTPTKKKNDNSPPGEHVHEQNTWTTIAIEDVMRGLERLGTAAKDGHKIDDSKTVEEQYSETLAKVIKEAEIKFDPKFLQEG